MLWDRSEGCKRPVSGDGDGRPRSERERVLLCIWRDVLCRCDIDCELRNETDECVRRITTTFTVAIKVALYKWTINFGGWEIGHGGVVFEIRKERGHSGCGIY